MGLRERTTSVDKKSDENAGQRKRVGQVMNWRTNCTSRRQIYEAERIYVFERWRIIAEHEREGEVRAEGYIHNSARRCVFHV